MLTLYAFSFVSSASLCLCQLTRQMVFLQRPEQNLFFSETLSAIKPELVLHQPVIFLWGVLRAQRGWRKRKSASIGVIYLERVCEVVLRPLNHLKESGHIHAIYSWTEYRSGNMPFFAPLELNSLLSSFLWWTWTFLLFQAVSAGQVRFLKFSPLFYGELEHLIVTQGDSL